LKYKSLLSKKNFNYYKFFKKRLKKKNKNIKNLILFVFKLWGKLKKKNIYKLLIKSLFNEKKNKKNINKIKFNKKKFLILLQNIKKNKKKKKEPNKNIYSKLGLVTGISDNIVSIIGLYDVAYGEMIEIITGRIKTMGMVLNIEDTKVSAIIFTSDIFIKPGQDVLKTCALMSVPIGDNLLGRIVDPLGNPLDSLGPIIPAGHRFIDSIAPSIISRKSVDTPLETGLKVVDSLVPIGHGQRELIIGDSKTGKTSIAIDAILNQINLDTINVYVAIGQKRSSVARLAKVLKKNNCLNSSIIVAATASDSAAMQYIAPYCACAMAEYFMYKGLRALIIYDDLSKHAVAYRQISLLLRRPPGREGYPGDVFYLHSRLLERAANLKTDGSITALPIIETIQGDVSAYIPTNVISITDGQIFLDSDLFSRGIRPSVSAGLSVSRVGSAAQSKTIKQMAGNLKLELAQFREVEDFTRLGFSLDDATKLLIEKGSRLTYILVQNRFNPIFIYKQILLLYAALNGYLNPILINFINFYENYCFFLLEESIFNLPLSKSLAKEFNEKIVNFFIWYVSYEFFLNNSSFLCDFS
jgi:F-type H+-transporting ATPase subunit alpha